MNKAQLITVGLVAIVAAGCAHRKVPAPRVESNVPYSQIFAERLEVVALPMLGNKAEVEVGQSMVSTARRYTTPAILTSTEIVHELAQQRTITLPPGNYALAGENADGKFYRSIKDLKLTSWGNTSHVVGGVFVPAVAAKPASVYFFPKPYARSPVMESHAGGIAFTPSVAERWDGESFRRELVYAGVSQNTISILYREFKDDMARPAFSQELKYDLSQGRSIGYKGARFEIEKATNISITYRVVRQLD